MKTLKFSLFCAMALVFVVGLSVPLIQAQGNLDGTWYKAKIKSRFTQGWLTGTDGTLVKVKPSLEYFFKVCDEGGTSDCGAVDYDVVLAIADFDGDGIFEADEVFDISLATCGPDETSFVAELDITDDLDGDPVTVEVFNQAANGVVTGNNNNSLRSKGCDWTANNALTAFDPDITGQKCKFRADQIAIADLPFTEQDLVDEGVIADVGDLNCTSTVFADAGASQVVDPGSLVFLDGSGSVPAGAGTLAWVFIERPPFSNAVLVDANTVRPSFIADEDGTYTVELTYTVGPDSDTDTVDVVVGPVTADAGPNQATLAGKVTLDGRASTPAGGTFNWVIIDRPVGSNAVLAGSNTANPTFIADEDGDYVILLTYTVGQDSDTDVVIVVVADL